MPDYPKNTGHKIPDKYRTRDEVKKHFSEKLQERLKEESSRSLESIIDGAYCEGYNQVLVAAQLALPWDEYWKIVEKLEELGV